MPNRPFSFPPLCLHVDCTDWTKEGTHNTSQKLVNIFGRPVGFRDHPMFVWHLRIYLGVWSPRKHVCRQMCRILTFFVTKKNKSRPTPILEDLNVSTQTFPPLTVTDHQPLLNKLMVSDLKRPTARAYAYVQAMQSNDRKPKPKTDQAT
jgi:hypothetical protein